MIKVSKNCYSDFIVPEKVHCHASFSLRKVIIITQWEINAFMFAGYSLSSYFLPLNSFFNSITLFSL